MLVRKEAGIQIVRRRAAQRPILLGEDYDESGVAHRAHSNLIGNIRAGRYFRPAENRAFAIWRAIGFS